MIDPQTEEKATLYVLDLLDQEERQAFQAELEESEALQELVGELSSSLHAPMQPADGPVRMDLLQGIHDQLDLDAGEATVVSTGPADKPVPWSHIWAVAASLLLFMNLLLVFIVSNQTDIRSSELLSRIPGLGEGSRMDSAKSALSQAVSSTTLEARISRLRAQLAERETELKQLLQSRSALEAEYKEVREYNADWQREYRHLAARVLPFFESKDGLSRFTVIEMVDMQTFDSQEPRRGFADLAGSFLTGEGNIAGVGSEDFVGPVAAGSGLADTPEVPSLAGIPEAALMDIAAPGEIEDPLGATDEAAMGFSVWRDDEQKGFLDIYNLPEAGDDRSAYLWVRASELDPYLPVGYLPELDDGTGSFFYSVDEPQFTPTEILVTAEDMYNPGATPSGPVLLIGP